MKISEKLKLPLIIIGLVLVLVIVLQIRSCVNERRIARESELEGKLQTLTEKAEKEKKEAEEAIQEMGKEIEQLSTEIREKNKTILELQRHDEEIIPTEIVDTPGEGQDWEKIAGINAQAAREWEAKYYKAQEIIEELGAPILEGYDLENEPIYRYPKDSVTGKLNTKYLLAIEQRDLYKKQLATKDNLLAIEREVINNKDKKIARLKIGKTLERIILTPLAVIGGLKLTGVLK